MQMNKICAADFATAAPKRRPSVDALQSVTKIVLRTPEGKLSAQVMVPTGAAHDQPPLFALHGISRDVGALYDAFERPATEAGRILIVPHFHEKDWKIFQRIGAARPDKSLLALKQYLRDSGVCTAPQIELFGYSGGAQLAHRFAMLYPQHVSRLHLGAAGWYCLPDTSLAYPAGLREPAAKPSDAPNFRTAKLAQLQQFLRIPLRVYVGTEDTERDAAMRTAPDLDAVQGSHRLARAATYVDRFAEAAARHQLTPDVSLTHLAGCGHDFSQCAERADLAHLVLS
jgi:pimeloyl-ACP methyl ester carboxylesterase